MKKTKWIIGLTLTGILAVSGTALALSPGSPTAAWQTLGANTPQYRNGGMMSGYNGPNSQGGYNGYGMMGGRYGGNRMMGRSGDSNGMMGGGYNAASLGVTLANGQVTSEDQVQAIANAYVKSLDGDFNIDEIHEFADSYEVELKENRTSTIAFEFLVYKKGGYISTEMGPNVMWNTQYGNMNWGNGGTPTVTKEQATQAAQNFVMQQLGEGYSVETPEIAPGYYEFMVLNADKDYAELDVNGYTGQVWFENWHGPILKTIEAK